MLQRGRQACGTLLVLGLLADRLDADPAVAATVPAALGLSGRLPVRFRLAAVADEPTLFDCETSPSWPLLSTRTGVFVLLAPCCAASEAANASCSFFASWPIAWIPPPPWP